MSTHIAPSANGPADKTRIVEAILDLEMPQWRLYRGIEDMVTQASGKPPAKVSQITEITTREAELNALSIDQLGERLTRAQQAKAKHR